LCAWDFGSESSSNFFPYLDLNEFVENNAKDLIVHWISNSALGLDNIVSISDVQNSASGLDDNAAISDVQDSASGLDDNAAISDVQDSASGLDDNASWVSDVPNSALSLHDNATISDVPNSALSLDEIASNTDDPPVPSIDIPPDFTIRKGHVSISVVFKPIEHLISGPQAFTWVDTLPGTTCSHFGRSGIVGQQWEVISGSRPPTSTWPRVVTDDTVTWKVYGKTYSEVRCQAIDNRKHTGQCKLYASSFHFNSCSSC
jgi:hypothetical protein